MPTLYIHCGLHKTGTTSLQSTLWENIDVLRSRGFLYPDVGVPRGVNLATGARFTGHHVIGWQLARDRRFDDSAGTFTEMLQAIEAFGGDAIISSEDFEASLLHPEAWMPFANLAASKGIKLNFVIYLRDVASYLESNFYEQTATMHGYEFSWFAREVLQYGRVIIKELEFCFDYDKVGSSMRLVPNSTLTVRSYNDLAGGSILRDFLSLLDPTDALYGAFGPELRQNSGRDVKVLMPIFLTSRDHRLDRPDVPLAQLTEQMFEGRAVKPTIPRRLRAALASRLTTTILEGREDYARKFMEASKADYRPPVEPGTQLINIARVFSAETLIAVRRILRIERAGRASAEWKARQIADWQTWVSDIS